MTGAAKERGRAQALAKEHLARGDVTGWFDALYHGADGDDAMIPWADMQPNAALVTWLDGHLDRNAKSALVVGCGLGDDAEELARRGLSVVAFDVSPRAVAWCKTRFPDSPVTYEEGDLLSAIARYRERFDFVFEAYTLQSLPAEVRGLAMTELAAFVAPTGTLLVVARGRDEGPAPPGPPWALARSEFQPISSVLREVTFDDFVDAEPTRRFRIVYARPIIG